MKTIKLIEEKDFKLTRAKADPDGHPKSPSHGHLKIPQLAIQ